MAADEGALRCVGARLSVRYKHIMFPIDLGEAMSLLKQAGFSPTARIEEPWDSLGRVVGSGRLATKGDLIVDVNTERQFVGVKGEELESVIDSFGEVCTALEKRKVKSGKLDQWFSEFTGRFVYECKVDPLELLNRATKKAGFFEGWDDVIGQPASYHHLRVSPPNRSVDSADYFDIVMAPDNDRPHDRFDFLFIYRSADRDKVVQFAKGVPTTVKQMVERLDQDTRQ